METRDQILDRVLPALVQRMQPGTSWRTKQHGRIHVLAVVDREHIVYKTWWKHKQHWHYAVEWVYGFYLHDKDGRLEYVGIFDNDLTERN